MTKPYLMLFWLALTIFVSGALYHTSYRVQELDQQLRAINTKIVAEQANIHVLKAEWVYLANPAKIEAAARKYLALHPTAPQQVATMDSLPKILPTQTEVLASAAKQAAPLASIATNRPTPAAVAATPQRKVAAADTDHINTRMVFQRTASAATTQGQNRILLADFGTAP